MFVGLPLDGYEAAHLEFGEAQATLAHDGADQGGERELEQGLLAKAVTNSIERLNGEIKRGAESWASFPARRRS